MDEYLSRNKKIVFFCLVVAVNLCVKILGISHNQIALDEPFSIYHSQFSISHIYHTLIEGNNPPAYEFFLHYWISIVGTDVFWVRLPSVIFSSVACGFWFMAAMYCMGLWYAVGCTFLFTFSTEYIYFSHEARAYALLLMVLAISTYLLVRLWNGEQKKSLVFAAAFFSALSIYVHYLAALPVALMGLVTVIRYIQKRDKGLLYYLLSTLLLVIPIGVLLFERLRAINVYSVWGVKPVWTQLYGFLNIFLNGRVTLVVLMLCILIGIGLFLSQKNKPFLPEGSQYVFIWGLIFVCSYVGMYIISFKHPIFIERYVQVAIPFFFLLLGNLFSALINKHRTGKFVGLVVLLVFCLQANIYPSNERNPQKVVDLSKAFLHESKGPVCLTPDWYDLNLAYYFNRDIFSSPHDELLARLAESNIIFVNNHGTLIFHGYMPSNILLIDTGEHFVTGRHQTLDLLLMDYDLERADSIDKQTTLYYLNIKQD